MYPGTHSLTCHFTTESPPQLAQLLDCVEITPLPKAYLAQFKYEPVGKSKQELEQEELEEKVTYTGNSTIHFDKKLWKGLELLANPKVSDEQKEWLVAKLKEGVYQFVSDLSTSFDLYPGTDFGLAVHRGLREPCLHGGL